MADNSADIGIRVFLDDAASRGLYAINGQLSGLHGAALAAGMSFGILSANMAQMALVSGLSESFRLFGGAIIMATEDAMEFELTMLRVQRATNATDVEMQAMSTTIMDISAKSIYNLEQVADGFVLMGQRGIEAKDIINGVGQAGVYLAESIGSTPVEAMGLLATTMQVFHMQADQATQAADLLQYAFEHGVPSTSSLTSAIGSVGAQANLLHIPLSEVVVLLDVLTRSMGSGEQAGTTLRYMMAQLAHPATDAAKDAFDKFGISLYDAHGNTKDFVGVLKELSDKLKALTPEQQADALATMFNVRSGKGAGLLMQQIDDVIHRLNDLSTTTNNHGKVTEQAQKVEQSAAGMWQSFLENIKNTGTYMGGAFVEQIKPTIQWLQRMSEHLLDFAKKNPQVVATFFGLAAAISGVGAVVALAMTPMGQVALIVVGVIAAIAGLSAGIMWLRAHWAGLLASGNPVVVLFQGIANTVRSLIPLFTSIGGFFMAVMVPAWKEFQKALAPAIPQLQQLGGMFMTYVVPILKVVAGIILSVLVFAIHILIGILAGLLTTIGSVLANLISAFMGIANVVVGFFKLLVALVTWNKEAMGEAWGQMWTGMQQIFMSIVNGIVNIAKGFWNILVGIFQGIISGIINIFYNLWSSLVGHSIVPDMMAGILNVVISFGPRVLGAFNSMISGLLTAAAGLGGKVLSALGSVGTLLYSAGQSLVQGFINGVVSWAQNLYNQVTNMLNNVRNMFPHSPAKEGPLRDAHTWMPNLIQQLAETADTSAPTLRASMNRVAGQAQAAFGSPSMGIAHAGGETYNLVLDGQVVLSFFHNRLTGQLQANGLGRLLR